MYNDGGGGGSVWGVDFLRLLLLGDLDGGVVTYWYTGLLFDLPS